MAGVKGKSGRNGFGFETRIVQLKGTLLDAVLEDCAKNPEKKLHWAQIFANKLLPQTIEGSGDKGEFVIKNIIGMSIIHEKDNNDKE